MRSGAKCGMSHATTKTFSEPLARNAAWIPPSAPIPE